jgi:hypothetical protein
MANNPKQQFQNLIQKGKQLLVSYESTKKSLKSTLSNAISVGLSEVVSSAAADIFESDYAGHRVRGLATAAMKQFQKNQLKELDSRTNDSIRMWSSEVVDCLRTVSSTSATAESPDYQRLVRRFLRTQKYVKPDTKMNHGIEFLENLVEVGLIANEGLPRKKEVKKGLITKAGERLEAYIRILEIFRGAQGFVKVVDVYPSEDTLLALKTVPDGVPVSFLTRPPQKSGDREMFEVLAKKLMNDRSEVAIRYENMREYHDRFILTSGDCWHVGHSIKDIGNKVSGITLMSENQVRELLEIFDTLWQKSEVLRNR